MRRTELARAVNHVLIRTGRLETYSDRRTVAQLAGWPNELMAKVRFEGATANFIASLTEQTIFSSDRQQVDQFVAFVQALASLLGDDRKKSLRELADTVMAQVPEEDDTGSVSRYAQHLAREWDEISSPLLPSGVLLAEVAVPVRLRDTGWVTGKPAELRLPGYRRSGPTEGPGKTVTLQQLAMATEGLERIIVLADPGMGKSTLIASAAADLARAYLGGASSRLPVVVQLAKFAKGMLGNDAFSVSDYLDSVGDSIDISELATSIRQVASAGQVVLLGDGLDEIPRQLQVDVITRIESALAQGSGNRWISTSRKVGFSGPRGASVFEIEPLGVEDQRAFMLKLCGWDRTPHLLRALAGSADLEDLATSPMMLTVLCLVARESVEDLAERVRRRSELYRVATGLLLEGRHRGGRGVVNPDCAEKVLARTSFLLHAGMRNAHSEDFASPDVERAVAAVPPEWLNPWQGTAHFLSDVSDRAGLLYSADSLGLYYRYLHRTIREYYAARDLSRSDETTRTGLISRELPTQHWAEVLVLLCGMLPDASESLVQLLAGPPDLALRAIVESKTISAELAQRALAIRSPNWRDRRRLFIELSTKLPRASLVPLLWSYVESEGERIARCDLYFIRDILLGSPDVDADQCDLRLLRFLPKVPEGFLSVCDVLGKSLPYWCSVPAGSFMFGASPDDPDRPPWVPVHTTVNLSAFEIGRVPVTNRVYEVFDPSHVQRRDFGDRVTSDELDEHPVVRVNWYEAYMFCLWARQTASGVRLPTEAEFEKAASWWPDGRKTRFPWGDDWQPTYLNSWEKGPNRTTRVGQYEDGRSPCGAFDMAGNVWEWCSDWFEEDQEAFSAFLRNMPVDPGGPSGGTRRVDRGGGWYHDVGLPCTFLRAADDPADEFSHCGFRVARGRC